MTGMDAKDSDAGWLKDRLWRPSPHYDERPFGMPIDLVIVHAISLPPGFFGGTAILDFFSGSLDAKAHPYFESIQHLRVSPHFFIDRQGVTVQCVGLQHRAWHAGVSVFEGRERCNDFSIGIELEGSDDNPFESVQYDNLIALLAEIHSHCPFRAVVGHSDVAPGRKTDPGPFFDWSVIRRAGF
jgi:N-acetyl-anhydromuramoyl-L-alanine amidase